MIVDVQEKLLPAIACGQDDRWLPVSDGRSRVVPGADHGDGAISARSGPTTNELEDLIPDPIVKQKFSAFNALKWPTPPKILAIDFKS